MEREKRSLYNKNSELTDKFYFKGDKIPENYYPMVVMVAIQNSRGEFLMQKRTPNKGGDWGITGGHPKFGETPLQGMVTEIKEELGLNIDEKSLIGFNSGCDGVDCYKMYYLKLDVDLKDITIQKEELTEVRWFTIEKLQEMVDTKELNPNQIAFFIKCCKFLNKD